MTRKMIVVGDRTSHGGVVVTGSALCQVAGKAVARLGDWVECPELYPDQRPHGRNQIIEGDNNYLLDGVPVALEGHLTECGCSLIASVSSGVATS
ncbi:PAAR domain-containing protein [Neisseriaceae bacterium TC5R-5]|nr:PAAR domain-containing protein [Neisseriaceae bacterium TC5R-5]MDF0607218.1 PAAR domain-containing protein [Neisseriaceae bacterium TC5R-5]